MLLVSTYVMAVIAMLLLSGASIATRPRKLSSIGTMKDNRRNHKQQHIIIRVKDETKELAQLDEDDGGGGTCQ